MMSELNDTSCYLVIKYMMLYNMIMMIISIHFTILITYSIVMMSCVYCKYLCVPIYQIVIYLPSTKPNPHNKQFFEIYQMQIHQHHIDITI